MVIKFIFMIAIFHKVDFNFINHQHYNYHNLRYPHHFIKLNRLNQYQTSSKMNLIKSNVYCLFMDFMIV